MELWSFNTENYQIVLTAEKEHCPPEDIFTLQSDVDAVRNGECEYFCAVVTVTKRGYEVGRDVLGCCAYKDFDDFVKGHRDPDPMNRNSSIMRKVRGDNVVICHYFPDMVRQAIAEARETIKG